MDAACHLCPRQCGALRFGSAAQTGFCGAGKDVRLFRWGPHFGEEPPITGERGSGCVFFSRCTMRCLYCQNSPWSWGGKGKDVSIAELRTIFRDLAVTDRVENWNLVSPTPYLPQIRDALQPLRASGISLPVVWNSSGYERVETLNEYADLCDWALFDLRYSREASAQRYSAAPNYVNAARDAVRWAWNRRGQTSLIVRILVLPGLADEAIENLAWLATELSSDVPVSLMCQYTPAYKAKDLPPLNRGVTADEYDEVTEAAADFGFEAGWTQDFAASDPALALLGENMGPEHGIVK